MNDNKSYIQYGTWQMNLYDAMGLRAAILENGKWTEFHTDRNKVIGEYDAGNHLLARYIRGIDLVSKEDGKDGLSDYLHNGHGDVTGLVDAEGNLLNSYRYDAFGNTTNYAETVANRFMYAGEQYDRVTGQYYLRARFYTPELGRFTQEDTFRGDGLNLYVYVTNNPLIYIDPTGHDKEKGTGNTSGNSSWNKWDVSKITSPGNFTGTNAGIFEVAGAAGQKYIPEAIKNTVRPNNIGAGTWNAYIADEAATAASKFSTVAKVAKGAGYVAVGVDVGFGIYDNVQAGAPTERIVSDAVVDTAFGGGGLLTSMAVGAGLGTLGCPVIGTVIGGAAAGIVYMVGTEVWKPGGQFVKDRAKEGLYNSIK